MSNGQINYWNVLLANGIEQGAVISPLLFSTYIDNLFVELKQLDLGAVPCWAYVRRSIWLR